MSTGHARDFHWHTGKLPVPLLKTGLVVNPFLGA